MSLAMLGANAQSLGAHDPALVLHLVASHHGLCRPFAPAFDDPDDLVVRLDGDLASQLIQASTADGARLSRLDSGVSERYWHMLRKFGWLGLPYLEAIFRLADHRESDLEECDQEAEEINT